MRHHACLALLPPAFLLCAAVTAAAGVKLNPAISKDAPIRAIIAHSAHGRSKELYDDPDWNAFAVRQRCLELVYPEMPVGDKYTVGQVWDYLDNMAREAAKQFSRPEIEHLPFILSSHSMIAMSHLAMAQAKPDKVIALVDNHSSCCRDYKDSNIAPGQIPANVPRLQMLAQLTEGRTELGDATARNVRKQTDAPWTTALHYGADHTTMPPQGFQVAWLEEVSRARPDTIR